MDDEISIRVATPCDVPSVLQLAKSVDRMIAYHYELETWMLVDPEGLFVAQIGSSPDHRIVGVCAGMILSDTRGFIGLYIVDNHFRRIGIGSRLWSAITDHLGCRNIGICGDYDNFKRYRERSGFTHIQDFGIIYYLCTNITLPFSQAGLVLDTRTVKILSDSALTANDDVSNDQFIRNILDLLHDMGKSNADKHPMLIANVKSLKSHDGSFSHDLASQFTFGGCIALSQCDSLYEFRKCYVGERQDDGIKVKIVLKNNNDSPSFDKFSNNSKKVHNVRYQLMVKYFFDKCRETSQKLCRILDQVRQILKTKLDLPKNRQEVSSVFDDFTKCCQDFGRLTVLISVMDNLLGKIPKEEMEDLHSGDQQQDTIKNCKSLGICDIYDAIQNCLDQSHELFHSIRQFLADAERISTLYSDLIIDVTEYDSQLHDYDRSLVVRRTISCPRNITLAAICRDQVVGYICLQPVVTGHGLIAPFYADSVEIAEVLLRDLLAEVRLSEYPGGLMMRFPDTNESCRRLVEKFNFSYFDLRICYGFNKTRVDVDCEKIYGFHSTVFCGE